MMKNRDIRMEESSRGQNGKICRKILNARYVLLARMSSLRCSFGKLLLKLSELYIIVVLRKTMG